MNRLKRKQADRPKAFFFFFNSARVGIASALVNSKAQEKQRRLQDNLKNYSPKDYRNLINGIYFDDRYIFNNRDYISFIFVT